MKKKLNLIVIIIGIIILIYGFVEYNNYNKEHNSYGLVEATVNEVILNGDKTKVGFEYFLNEKYYFSKVETDKTFEVGEKTKVYYLKSDPENCKIQLVSISKSIIIFLIGGLIFLLGIVLSMNKVLANSRVKKLKKKGILIKATIQEVLVVNKNAGKNPYKIRATYLNPQDKKTYTYISEEEETDLKDIVSRNNIRNIDVYINPKNTEDYYVDIESIIL